MPLDAAHDLVLLLFVALLGAAAASDILRFRIPNRIVLALAALFPLHLLTSPVPADWMGGLAAGLGLFALGAVLFARGALGGGDVKLLAACALWAGPAHLPALLLVTALSGGVLALFALSAARLTAIYAFTRLGIDRGRDMLMDGQLPYGLAIAAGGVAVAWRLSAAA